MTNHTALLAWTDPAAVASRKAVRAGRFLAAAQRRAESTATAAATAAVVGVMRGQSHPFAHNVNDVWAAPVRKFATNRAMSAAPASTRAGGSGTEARAIESVGEILATAYVGAVEALAAAPRVAFVVDVDGTASPLYIVRNGKTRQDEATAMRKIIRRAIRRATARTWPQDRTTDAAAFVTRGVAVRTDADGMPLATGDVVAPRGVDAGTVAVLQAAAIAVLATGADVVSANGRPTIDVWRAVATAHGWGSGTAAVRRAREAYGAMSAGAVSAASRKGTRSGGSAPDGTRYIGTARMVGTRDGK